MFTDKKIVEFNFPRRVLRRKLKDLNKTENVLLFLQCPIGPIGKQLLVAARDGGFNPIKIDFNAGDRLFSKTKYSISYHGQQDEWDEWIGSFLGGVRPVGIVLMGDMRPIHQVAIRRARSLGIPVFCLEEGYIRPNFVTLEIGGVNANSPLRREFPVNYRKDPDYYKKLVHSKVDIRPVNNEMIWAVISVIRYYTAKVLGYIRYRNYVHHRDRPVLLESFMWTRGYAIKLQRSGYNKSKSLDLIEHCEGRYFVVALQVADDMQLRCHGRKWTNQTLITKAISEFADNAPPDCHLVVKGHPLDRGRYNYWDLARKIARLNNCEDRVHYVDDGSISPLLRHSCGLVTINSTSGLSALFHGKPILALGDALYSIEGLVNPSLNEDCLARFFANPIVPDIQMAEAFLEAIRRTALVNGSFYHPQSINFTARNIVDLIKSFLEGQKSLKPDFSQLGEPVQTDSDKRTAARH